MKTIFIIIVYYFISFLQGRYWNGFLYRLGIRGISGYLSAFFRLSVMMLLLLILAAILGFWDKSFYRRNCVSFFRGLFLGTWILVFSAASMVWNTAATDGFQDIGTICYSTLFLFMVSMTEEFVFRAVVSGSILEAVGCPVRIRSGIFSKNEAQGRPETETDTIYYLADHGIILSVILSGFIFSLAHVSNFRSSDFSGVLIQMAGAFLMGMTLTAIYYRTANLWVVVFLHFVNDVAAAFPVTVLREEGGIAGLIGTYGLRDLFMLLPYLIVLSVLLRKQGRQEIRKLWQQLC